MQTVEYVPNITRQKFVLILLSFPVLFFLINLIIELPANWRNKGFALIYGYTGLVLIGVQIVSFWEREKRIHVFLADNYPVDVTVFQVAGLLHGKDRALQTGILDLAFNKLLLMNEDRLFTVCKGTVPHANSNPLAAAFSHVAAGTKVSYEEIEQNWFPATGTDHPGLVQLREEVLKMNDPFGEALGLFFVFGLAEGIYRWSRHQPDRMVGVELAVFLVLTAIVIDYYGKQKVVARSIKEAYRTTTKVTETPITSQVVDFAFGNYFNWQHLPEGETLSKVFRAKSSAEPVCTE